MPFIISEVQTYSKNEHLLTVNVIFIVPHDLSLLEIEVALLGYASSFLK